MSMDLFNRVADEAQAFIKHTYLHLWGEPTLNPNLPQMIRRTKQFSTIDLATHGLFITEELADAISECDTVSVSIDGIDQEVYERYRVGGKLERAMEGLRLLVKKCKRVNWTFVVFKDNEHQIPQAQKIADEIGANIGFKPPLFWDRTKINAQMPTNTKYHRYRLVDGEWKLKFDRLTCRDFWEAVYVLPSGDVVTCCYDGNAEYPMGNVIKEGSLLAVWNGPAYTEMRRNHAAGRLNEMCQKYCNQPA